MASLDEAQERRIDAVRVFNRNYTRSAGLIAENHLETRHSLTEARVIWELSPDHEITVGELRDRIGLDAGYMSRVVSRLEGEGLIAKRRSSQDARRTLLRLTGEGAAHRATLDRRSGERVRELLDGVDGKRADAMIAAMRTINGVLSPAEPSEPVVLRPPEPGDLGWIVNRHGELYWREYGWGRAFEALVAGVIAEHADSPDSRRDAAWIADLGGERAGSILCVGVDERIAKLRLLLVEPAARGRGIGRMLVDECVRFARAASYERLVLWTNDVLTHARPIYEAAGFELDRSEPHRTFGPEVVGQDWSLAL